MHFTHLLNQANTILQAQTDAPQIAVQLGTGLSHLFDDLLVDATTYSYGELFEAAAPTALSHRGSLRIGRIGSLNIAVFEGRLHLYEGHPPTTVCQNVVLAKLLGCQSFIITNAAGALTAINAPGDLVLLKDHLNLTGRNPLIGLPAGIAEHFGIEHPFTDMLNAYCPALAKTLQSSAKQLGIGLKTAVYAGLVGPSLETSAERRMLAALGADVVGMSTVNEVIMSRYLGMTTAGLSIITNMATGGVDQQADTIDQILDYARIGGEQAGRLLVHYLKGL